MLVAVVVHHLLIKAQAVQVAVVLEHQQTV
jgi:hypothetical protein